MVISWRSRETDPSLTPTKRETDRTGRFSVFERDRRGGALENGLADARSLSLPPPPLPVSRTHIRWRTGIAGLLPSSF